REAAGPEECIGTIYCGFRQPFMIDPGTVAGERVMVDAWYRVLCHDILPEQHVAPQIGVRMRASQDDQHQHERRRTYDEQCVEAVQLWVGHANAAESRCRG